MACSWISVEVMFKPKNIPTDHKDLIHDVAYNYHGRRMATCSSDQYVKVGTETLIIYAVMGDIRRRCVT